MTDEFDPTDMYPEGTKFFTLPSGEKVVIDDNSFIETDIVLDPSALIDHDLEGFLDLVSMCVTDTELLCQTEYTAKSVTMQGNIIFTIKGDVSMILDCEADNGGS